MITEDKINSFQERADTLRHELIDAIVTILKENNLTEIKLSKRPNKVPWVVWFDRRNYGYDSRVTKVSLDGNGIAVEVYDEDCCCSATMTSDETDLACTNIDWLCKILNCVNYTISLPKSAGITTIAGQLIEWSYDEPGLSELPEGELGNIETALTNGTQKGELCYYDEYDVQFNGVWNIKMIEPNKSETQSSMLKAWNCYLEDNSGKEPKYANVTIRFKDDDSEGSVILSFTDYIEEIAERVFYNVQSLQEFIELANEAKDATVQDFIIISFDSYSNSI